MKKKIVYEQPLNERIRNLLRLEHLFAGIMYRLKGPAEWDSRDVMDNLLLVFDILDRIDFKVELIKDLDYHTQTLERWQRTPNVDSERLTKLLNQTKMLSSHLEELDEGWHEALFQYPLFHQIRQRAPIAGGTCRSDLPGYYHWLQKNPKQRQQQLSDWLTPLFPLHDAIALNLYLIRNNAISSQEVAENGYFQSKLAPHLNYQIIQVALSQEHPYYPEISGGKQRITIRFFEQADPQQRPLQSEQNIHFELNCCSLQIN